MPPRPPPVARLKVVNSAFTGNYGTSTGGGGLTVYAYKKTTMTGNVFNTGGNSASLCALRNKSAGGLEQRVLMRIRARDS